MRRALAVTTALLGLVAIAEAAVLGGLALRARWRRSALASPVSRGRALADRMGCFGCHGPGGASPIPNPGSKSGEVPQWGGGTWMMWNHDAADLREWIRSGHPKGRAPDRSALVAMPSYGDRLSPDELDDLVAYVLADSLFGWPDDPKVASGRDAAVKFGCFGCHGPEGRGLVWNPGSFKGYVPPWDGEDYADLVRSDDEFREWVRKGISDRFAANPLARRFLETQAIRMPVFGDRISADELEGLLAYVRWARANPRGGGVGERRRTGDTGATEGELSPPPAPPARASDTSELVWRRGGR